MASPLLHSPREPPQAAPDPAALCHLPQCPLDLSGSQHLCLGGGCVLTHAPQPLSPPGCCSQVPSSPGLGWPVTWPSAVPARWALGHHWPPPPPHPGLHTWIRASLPTLPPPITPMHRKAQTRQGPGGLCALQGREKDQDQKDPILCLPNSRSPCS